MQWSNRELKQISREYVLEDYSQEAAAIFMPGWDDKIKQSGQDIRTALNMGALCLHKPLYVVERNPVWAKLIEADLLSLGFSNLIVHVGELSTLDLIHKVDFSFIDLFGALDQDICLWLRDKLAPALEVNATVALTMAYSRRNNHFMAECERIYGEEFKSFTGDIRQTLHISGHQKLVPVLLFKSIFEHHLFAYRRLFKYRDTSYTMLTYKFTDFTKIGLSNGAPPLNSVLDKLCKRTNGAEKETAMTSRSDAANKAWATRRANGWVHPTQRQQKLSEAANKAWATRRASGWVHPKTLAKKRSDAANKAWATRRANGWVHPSRVA